MFYPSNIKVTKALDDLQHIKVEKHRSHKELYTVGWGDRKLKRDKIQFKQLEYLLNTERKWGFACVFVKCFFWRGGSTELRTSLYEITTELHPQPSQLVNIQKDA